MSLLLRAIVAGTDATAARGDGSTLLVVAAGRVAAIATAHEAKSSPTSEALLEHHRVVQSIFDRVPCLPARFGSVFPDERALGMQLADREDELATALARIGFRCELAITLAWRDKGDATVGGHGGSGRAYLERSSARERVSRERERRAKDLTARLLAELSTEPALLRHETCPRASVAVSMAALVKREALGGLRSRIERLGSTFPDVTTIVQGPWAPYSFAVTA